MTGSVPGCPSVIGLVCVFGEAPYALMSAEYAFVFVSS